MADKGGAWTKETIGYSERMPRHYPTEYLLRSICSRSYFEHGKDILPGQKVLDIGCLYLNNLMPSADRGVELYGVEINDEVVAVATERAPGLGARQSAWGRPAIACRPASSATARS